MPLKPCSTNILILDVFPISYATQILFTFMPTMATARAPLDKFCHKNDVFCQNALESPPTTSHATIKPQILKEF